MFSMIESQPLELSRPNQVLRRDESWRPPSFRRVSSRWDSLVAAARRLLDLQASSVYRDLRLLLPPLRGVILDVGCGAQPYRPLIGPQAVYRAIDQSEAYERFGYSVPDTTYYEGDAWPIDSSSVDVVLSTETLEHVAQPRAFLLEAWRCLKPGGRIVLTVPFAARWHYIPHDYWRFTPSGLLNLLESAGFHNVTVYARGNAFCVACYKVMALFLPLLLTHQSAWPERLLSRTIGVICLPLICVLGLLGNLSLMGKGGDDCLGYTAIAARPSEPAQ
ncbi:MAG: class I SAM-dependent methyltransferase [Isosphaeraceae bacterium]